MSPEERKQESKHDLEITRLLIATLKAVRSGKDLDKAQAACRREKVLQEEVERLEREIREAA